MVPAGSLLEQFGACIGEKGLRVRSDLMALVVHTLDDRTPRGRIINRPFPQIVPGDEEGCADLLLKEDIEELGCVLEGAIIEGTR